MRSTVICGAILMVLLTHSGGAQQSSAKPGADWPMYRHDQAGTGYSPLTQINLKNVATLTRAWTYRLQSDTPPPAPAGGRGGAGGGVNSQATPIVVDGVMYLPAANRVVALEADSGKEIWQYPVAGGAPSRRGVAYWPGDGTIPARIIFTSGRRVIALDARSGTVAAGFGKDGEVD